jgi:hypothetical protein
VADELFLSWARALNAWEEWEIDLSWLYAIVAELQLHSTEAYRAYVERADNFSQRLAKVETATIKYFHRKPDQNNEADFCLLLKSARGWSFRRNDIAHSVIRPMPKIYETATGGSFEDWLNQPDEFLLYPPDYAANKHDDAGRPAYAYGLSELDAFAHAFRSLGFQTGQLSLRLRERRS